MTDDPTRTDGRRPDELRPVSFSLNYVEYPEGSVLIELGRTRILIKEILALGHGSVIEFDRMASEPVDLLINDKKVAEGEVVVIEEHFGIRLTSLAKPADRIKKLGA